MNKHLISILVLFLLLSTSFMGVSNQMTINAKKSEKSIDSGLQNSSWPMYCHDIRHTGQSLYTSEKNLGGIVWKFQVKGGMDSSPAVDKNGTIYIGNDWNKFFAVYANGTEKWSASTSDWTTSSPAIDNSGTIYIGSWDNNLYAVKPDGTLKWKFYTQDTVRSSPIIGDDGIIYFGVLGPGFNIGRIYALYPNGTEKWHVDTGNWVYSSGALDEQGTIYFTSNDGKLYAINPNGTIKWTYGVGSAGSPSVGDDGTIYVSSNGGYLYAIYQNGTMKWRSPIGWGSGHVPSIANDGTIYIGGDEMYAIYPNGTRKWTFALGRFYDVTSESQAISADGTIFFGVSNDTGTGGYLIAVDSNGIEKWREWIHDAWVYSSPSIGTDGTVYIGSTWAADYGILYAFNGKKFEAPVIEQPKPGKLYLFNKETLSTLSGKTVAIGKITIEVSHPDPMNVSKVQFYLDNAIQYEDTSSPYEWTWSKVSFGPHTITVTAVNKTGMTKTVGITVWKFF